MHTYLALRYQKRRQELRSTGLLRRE